MVDTLESRSSSVLVLLLVACASAATAAGGGDVAAAQATPAPAVRYRINDGHQHLLDLVQGTDGLEVLLAEMDRLGVEHTMLTGFPVVEKWDIVDPIRPTYYLDNDASVYYYGATDVVVARAVSALAPAQRTRVHPRPARTTATGSSPRSPGRTGRR